MPERRRGSARTGNPFHRVPLLFTTKDTEGKLISFMPGGPRILDSRKQDVVVCMTLDAENNEIPIPFMGDGTGVVHEMSDLSETPQDGLSAIVEQCTLYTEGDQRPPASAKVIDELFFAFDQPLSALASNRSIELSVCKFGLRTTSLLVMFLQNASLLEIEGLENTPIMLIADGGDEPVNAYFHVPEDCIISTPDIGLENQELKAGWNYLRRIGQNWTRTSVAVSAIPSITDAVIEEISEYDSPTLFISTSEWLWNPGLAFSLGGMWHILDGEYVPPPFLAVLAVADRDTQWDRAAMINTLSVERWKNGEYLEPTMVDRFKIWSVNLTYSGELEVNIPTSTAHTIGAIKAAIEAELTNVTNTGYNNAAKITISSFSWEENSGNIQNWSGTLVWEYPDLYEGSWTEPIERYGVNFRFYQP